MIYEYEAFNEAGIISRGVVEADTAANAHDEVARRRLTIIKIKEQSVFAALAGFQLEKKPSSRDLSVFCKQFVSVIEAGVPIVPALEILEGQTENKRLSKILRKVRTDVESGKSLESAFRPHQKIFGGQMFLSLVHTGEESGSLAQSLDRMGDQYEKDMKIKSTLQKAAIYPAAILVALVGIIIVMLTFVVPRFQDMFDQIGTELPPITLFLVDASHFMERYWMFVVAGLVALVLIVRAFLSTAVGHNVLSVVALSIPPFKGLATKSASARMTRTLSTLLGSGITMLEAINISTELMTNSVFRRVMEKAEQDISQGIPLSESLKATKRFPKLVYQMTAIGEESGNTQSMLNKVANYYDQEVESAVAQAMALIEPVIIILMAGVVAVMLAAIFGPILSLYNGLDNL